jgi:hypothetical protein
MILPLSVFAQTKDDAQSEAPQLTVRKFIEHIVEQKLADVHLLNSYNAFQKNPTRRTFDAYESALRYSIADIPFDMGVGPNTLRNIAVLREYMDETIDGVTKLTKFNLADKRSDKEQPIAPCSLELHMTGGTFFLHLPALKGSTNELPADNYYVNDFNYDRRGVIFHFVYAQPNQEKRISKKFEVSLYEIIAKSIDTGELEFELYDKNLDSSVTVKIYNLPSINLLPLKTEKSE